MTTTSKTFLLAALAGLAACADAPPSAAKPEPERQAVTCVRDTGSRIPRPAAEDCQSQPGRSYDRQAIDQTGATNAADALRQLDPSVTTH